MPVSEKGEHKGFADTGAHHQLGRLLDDADWHAMRHVLYEGICAADWTDILHLPPRSCGNHSENSMDVFSMFCGESTCCRVRENTAGVDAWKRCAFFNR